jgi:hypothetical protein
MSANPLIEAMAQARAKRGWPIMQIETTPAAAEADVEVSEVSDDESIAVGKAAFKAMKARMISNLIPRN